MKLKLSEVKDIEISVDPAEKTKETENSSLLNKIINVAL